MIDNRPAEDLRSVDEASFAAAFFERPPEQAMEEGEPGDTDEWSAASLTSRLYTVERPNHVGGPQERIISAMPARTIALRRRPPQEEAEPAAPIPRNPSDEERARTARRTTEARPETGSPLMTLSMIVVLAALATMLVVLFGARSCA
jgi:hypothetical protein